MGGIFADYPSPVGAGKSHVSFYMLLCWLGNWILRVSPDLRGDTDAEILFIALLATLCGATSCTDMVLFARMKAYLWQDLLVLKHGLPSHDTFSRVFRMLDPQAFEKVFRRFMKVFAAGANIKRPRV